MLSNRCKNISENMYRKSYHGITKLTLGISFLMLPFFRDCSHSRWHHLCFACWSPLTAPFLLRGADPCTSNAAACIYCIHHDTVEDWKEEQQEMVRRCWWACTVDSDLRTNRRSARRVERMGRPARRTGRPRNAQTPQPCTADEQELTWSGTSPPRWCPQLLATCPSNSTSRSCNGDGAKRRIFGLEKWKTMKWCHQCADGEGRRERNGGILSDDDISSVW